MKKLVKKTTIGARVEERAARGRRTTADTTATAIKNATSATKSK